MSFGISLGMKMHVTNFITLNHTSLSLIMYYYSKSEVRKFHRIWITKLDFCFFYIEVWLIYNVLVSSVQQSDSFIYTHIYMYIYFRFFSIIGYHKILSSLWYTYCGRSLLFTYFIYSSVYMLIPNS